MRILLVAPGPTHSTYDIYKYYLDAMEGNEDVVVAPFNYHNVAAWQKLAVMYYKPELPEEEATIIGASRAARELLSDVIIFQPDVVFVVSGTMLPDFIWKHLVNLRNKLTTKFAIALYLTESPYLDEMQEHFRQYADVTFVNDLYTVNKWNPDRSLHIHYLPHSFNPKVHHRMYGEEELADKKSDVFFLGTPFYERGELLAAVDWNNIDFLLGGNWAEFCRPEDYLKLAKFNFHTTMMPNVEVAKYYAATKVALNIHRTRPDVDGRGEVLDNHKDAYSIGPRIYEAAAGGAFILSDYRKELVDIFGDSVALFDSGKDLNREIKFWISDKADSLREEKALAAKECISECTFGHRLNNVLLPVFEEVLLQR